MLFLRLALLTLPLMSLAGCFFYSPPTDDEVRCASGGDCPESEACWVDKRQCVQPSACLLIDQGEATPVSDGNRCDDAAGEAGLCRAGVCTPSVCGDGLVDDETEACDDGNRVDGDDCTNACTVARCGDGVIQIGIEACDDGNDITEDECTNDCVAARCGDAVVQAGVEACDDGNIIDDDACRNTCEQARCGDGVRYAADEDCDDGNNDDGDSCTATCRINVCGDGVVWNGVEACDDGNTVSGDGCRDDCQKVEVCGDAVVDANEACDDGNDNPNDICNACAEVNWSASVIGGMGPTEGLAANTPVPYISAVAADPAGGLIVGIVCKVFRLSVDGTLTRLSGERNCNNTGIGEAATDASLDFVRGLVAGADGTTTIATKRRILRIDPDGIIRSIGGTGSYSDGDGSDGAGDYGPAVDATFIRVMTAGKDAQEQLLIVDADQRVRRVGNDGIIVPVAGVPGGGNGLSEGDGGSALDATFTQIQALAPHPDGRLAIADGDCIRIVELDGTIQHVAGDCDLNGSSPDGTAAASARFDSIEGLAWGPDGLLYFSDSVNGLVRRISGSGLVETVVGNGETMGAVDGEMPLSAAIAYPRSLTFRADGFLAIHSGQDLLGYVDASTPLTVLLGQGSLLPPISEGRLTTVPWVTSLSLQGDGTIVGLAAYDDVIFKSTPAAGFVSFTSSKATDMALAPNGNIYFSTVFPTATIGVVETDKRESLVLTDGAEASLDDPVVMPTLDGPRKLVVDGEGRLLFVSGTFGTQQIFRFDGTTVQALTSATQSAGGEGSLAEDTSMYVTSMAAAPGGEIVVSSDDRIFRFVAGGVVERVAGSDTGSAADGILAVNATVQCAESVTTDAVGQIYYAERCPPQRIRRIGTDGVVETIAGGPLPFYNDQFEGEDGPATASALFGPDELAVNSAGEVVFVDQGIDYAAANEGLETSYLRKVDASGVLRTIAGRVVEAGGTGWSSTLTGANRIVRVGDETLLLDSSVGQLMGRDAAGAVSVHLGVLNGFDLGAFPGAPTDNPTRTMRRLQGARGLAYDGVSTLYIAESDNSGILAVHMTVTTDSTTWRAERFIGVEGEAGHADGDFVSTRFVAPEGLTFSEGVLYVADAGDHTIRTVDVATGQSDTLMGVVGVPGVYAGYLSAPSAVLLDEAGRIFVADTGNHRVVRRDLDGTEMVVLGTGEPASSGDGAPATTFPVHAPRQMTFDRHGNLAVTSTRTLRLLEANASGIVDGSGAVRTLYGHAPRDGFPENATFCLSGVLEADDGVFHITDRCQGYLIAVER